MRLFYENPVVSWHEHIREYSRESSMSYILNGLSRVLRLFSGLFNYIHRHAGLEFHKPMNQIH
jgi:hypothetical protein